MEQLSLYFEDEEIHTLKNVVKRSYRKIKKLYPSPVEGETLEDYRLFLRDETLLEIANQLTEIALHRQNEAINFLYKGIKYE